MPHGLFFFVSCFFSLTVWHVRSCTIVAVLPLRPRGGREGVVGRQVGKTASRPCGPTLPRRGRRVGMHSQVGVQGVAGHCLGYVLHDALHMLLHSTYPIQYRITVCRARLSIYYSTHHLTGQTVGSGLVCRGQHFSPSGLAGSGNDKDKGREAGARDARFGTVPVTVPGTVPVRWYRLQGKCLLTLQFQCRSLVYTACWAPCIRTWKVCAIHNTHTRTPKHPPTRSHLRL